MQINCSIYTIQPVLSLDHWGIYDFVSANKDRLNRYFPKTLAQNLTPELSQVFVENKIREFNSKKEILFTLKPQNANKIVGLIYLKAIDWIKKQGEFAYCIDYKHKGKGVISEAIALLSKHAFNELKLETLQIIVHKSNTPSITVATSCHFTWIKTLKKAFTPPKERALNMELYELYHKIN
ncbi:GNAT family N-acetyltransferase [Tamlana fucoidanivorans]|uniref:GNAT family N-acetyltransferase n=1 Tax=Allotamlana fucoidanivorans TaxID=2583814 RepID=A0A5C4SS29_9FLAO|nr:GNAT family N-acetyltransferase [Tamlana fucoidanivorans]TNJ47240.1 GNAT family N-acetyltransferase [Tamlana fucoidanivorans]